MRYNPYYKDQIDSRDLKDRQNQALRRLAKTFVKEQNLIDSGTLQKKTSSVKFETGGEKYNVNLEIEIADKGNETGGGAD